jgi:hypothetical protein
MTNDLREYALLPDKPGKPIKELGKIGTPASALSSELVVFPGSTLTLQLI